MAGGVAILLLVIALIAIAAVALWLSGTGGLLWWRKTDPQADRTHTGADPLADEGEDPGRRPRHTAPTTPAQEHTDFAGSGESDRGGS